MITAMKRALLSSLVGLVVFSAGCSGQPGEGVDADPIATTESKADARKAVLDALDVELGLDEFAEVDDTFSPSGEDCQLPSTRTEKVSCCVIEMVYIGEEVGFFLSKEVVVAPDESFSVEVGKFSGTDRAECLRTADKAVQAIGAINGRVPAP